MVVGLKILCVIEEVELGLSIYCQNAKLAQDQRRRIIVALKLGSRKRKPSGLVDRSRIHLMQHPDCAARLWLYS